MSQSTSASPRQIHLDAIVQRASGNMSAWRHPDAAGDASTSTSGGHRKIAAISNIGSGSSRNRQLAFVSGLPVEC
ncbi:hypothetical protein [Burkholderia cepacia]|uniref:Uncharacterized protein n=1 Tax=Burkholderia cepacia TaxID=292 RepID=A0AAQ0JIU6_BURCE|nr:hypothetical protein [Burkholderia cepacia]KVH72729.1 hypothetical protein WJ42_24150 [Burkholderia cepacia]KWC72776.1 hypothetical protein WL55_09235 [Burkholderia cepacia]MCA8282603.1 hypothetical protein [Burkholderia cepacia]MDN7856135.1 hypothetical protein [Burkholderia cepacia]RAQ07044.1 hypothetical protein DPR02_21125 [Burkholderia cepacia]